MEATTKKTLLLIFLGAILLCAAIAGASLFGKPFGNLTGDILGATALFGAACLLASIAVILWARNLYHPLGPCVIALTAAAFCLTVPAIWHRELGLNISATLRAFWMLAPVLWTVASALALMGLAGLARLSKKFRWVRRWTCVFIGLLGLSICATIVTEPHYPAGDIYWQAIGFFAIASACGILTMPILHFLSAIQKGESVRTTELTLTLTCPRCETSQRLASGRSKCIKCGLGIVIQIEEEQCPACGYPLYKLESSNCPECGAKI